MGLAFRRSWRRCYNVVRWLSGLPARQQPVGLLPFTGDAREDILNMSAVHPIREETMGEILRKNRADRSLPDQLVREKEIREVIYQDKKFWIRNFTKK